MIQACFRVSYPDFCLNVDVRLAARGITALFGPSGSGKTTLLRCIAGLERVPGGMLRIDDEVWQDDTLFRPTHQRSLGYVFQEASLFPNMSVRRNLEYGWQRILPSERKIKLDQVVALLELSKLIGRDNPNGLSGGERQRIAIGRALLASPRMLLMDEPLSSLDAASKQEVLHYLDRLHCELDIPVVYVSHSLAEVVQLADHLVLLDQGRIIANGPIAETLSRLDLPTSRLNDASTVIETTIGAHDDDYHLTQLNFPKGSLWVSRVEKPSGSLVRVCVLARDVSIATSLPQNTSINNVLVARIAEIQNEGLDRIMLRLAVGDQHMLLARITHRSCDQLGLDVNMEVFAQVKSVALVY